MKISKYILSYSLLLFLGTAAAGADKVDASSGQASGTFRQSDLHKEKRLFWGDMHLHTNYSIDANMFGNTKLGPADAYRFARGEPVTGNSGMRAQLTRPLDFLAVTDHGEFLGLIPAIRAKDPTLEGFERTKSWRAALAAGDISKLMALWSEGPEKLGNRVFAGPEFATKVWREYASIADGFNSPGKFTTFIAYEWTGKRGRDNLHRNVLFADHTQTATRVRPFTSADSQSPEDLWRFLADYEARTGGRVLAMPHNSNLSGGRMFRPTDSSGKPVTADYAERRARWEPLVEITQVKGDSETHPLLSPKDAFADFGRWDTNLAMRDDVIKSSEEYPFDYVRSALTLGLQLERRIGVNPFSFGVVGSTDSHTSLSTTHADNYWGKFSKDEPYIDRALAPVVPRAVAQSEAIYSNGRLLSSGLAAVWAESNTRQAIFDALERKEVYATTGPRITLRFFGGWSFSEEDAADPDFARIGYSRGVPMGGVLRPAQLGKPDIAPRFLVSAQRDPLGVNLDRIQVVKGWLDSKGRRRELVYDVLWSDDRKMNPDGHLPPVGSSVSVESGTYENTIGMQEAFGLWRDPDFDHRLPAFYYLRVLEIPTPRWPLHDSVRYRSDKPEGIELIAQQRAYSSPIWYVPE